MTKDFVKVAVCVFAFLSTGFSQADEVTLSSKPITLPSFLNVAPQVAATAWVFPGWAFSAIPIKNCVDLNAINSNLAGDFVLKSNIDCAGQALTIGTAEHPFSGRFEGSVFKISNIKLPQATSLDNAGLFVTTPNAVIGHLSLNNVISQLDLTETRIEVRPQGSDAFGTSVSLQDNTLAIGDPFDATAGFGSGAVYIFQKTNNVWQKTDKVMAASPIRESYFGTGVTLSGTHMLVNADPTISTPVYVFEHQNNSWKQVLNIAAIDGAVLSGDYMVTFSAHAVILWKWVNNTWTTFLEANIPSDRAVKNVAFDGKTLLVVTEKDFNREVRVYRFDGTTIVFIGSITSPSPGETIGTDIGLDGDTAFVSDGNAIYNFDVTQPINDPTHALTSIATISDFPNSMIGKTIRASKNILAFSVLPDTYQYSTPTKERVEFYKKLEDGIWHRVGEVSPSDFMPYFDQMGIAYTSGYGLSFDFSGQDIFVGAPHGKNENPPHGALYLYTHSTTIDSPVISDSVIRQKTDDLFNSDPSVGVFKNAYSKAVSNFVDDDQTIANQASTVADKAKGLFSKDPLRSTVDSTVKAVGNVLNQTPAYNNLYNQAQAELARRVQADPTLDNDAARKQQVFLQIIQGMASDLYQVISDVVEQSPSLRSPEESLRADLNTAIRNSQDIQQDYQAFKTFIKETVLKNAAILSKQDALKNAMNQKMSDNGIPINNPVFVSEMYSLIDQATNRAINASQSVVESDAFMSGNASLQDIQNLLSSSVLASLGIDPTPFINDPMASSQIYRQAEVRVISRLGKASLVPRQKRKVSTVTVFRFNQTMRHKFSLKDEQDNQAN